METKVKILADIDMNALVERINDFIKDKDVVDIKFTTVCYPVQTVNGLPSKLAINDRALIIYREYKIKTE